VSESRTLDVEVAVRLEGYRWVHWIRGADPDGTRQGPSRFLAPPEHQLAHLWVSAPVCVPLARQPFRYLPTYSRDVGPALRVCQHCGLFREGSAALTQEPDGRWRVTLRQAAIDLEGHSLPTLLCRAVLAWSSRVEGAAEVI